MPLIEVQVTARPRHCLSANSTPTISPREKQILDWLKEGKTNEEIGMIFDISRRTVKFHVANICVKLDVVSRTQAVVVAIKLGVLDP